jgi:hypothetical protein
VTREELLKSIEANRQEIYQVKGQLDQVTDPQEEKQLLVRLKELQIKQIWYMDQVDAW